MILNRFSKAGFFEDVQILVMYSSSIFDNCSGAEPANYHYTANVYRELQGLYGEIRVQGFQIYGDCMYTRNPCNFENLHTLISIVIFAGNLILL